MTTNNTKTVYLLICSKAPLHVHYGTEVSVTTAFEVVGEWDDKDKEYLFSDCRAYFYVGDFNTKKVPFHCFESGEMRHPGFIPNIGDISTDEVLEQFQTELNAETPTSPEESKYAETVFRYWRGEFKYDTVTITEAV